MEDTIQITQERTALASLFCHHMHVVFMTFMCSATANLYLSWCISWQLRLQEVEYGLELGGTITIDLQNRILGVPGGPEMGIRVQLVGITQPVRRSILDILLGSELPPLISLMGMLSTSSPSNFSHEMETTMSLFTFSTIFPSTCCFHPQVLTTCGFWGTLPESTIICVQGNTPYPHIPTTFGWSAILISTFSS